MCYIPVHTSHATRAKLITFLWLRFLILITLTRFWFDILKTQIHLKTNAIAVKDVVVLYVIVKPPWRLFVYSSVI
jgi:hypothetical protein